VSCDTTSIEARPIQLGVSGSNLDSVGNGFCCAGTLGSLVRDTLGNEYILSNHHVMVASDGQRSIVQPGLADSACLQNASLGVANLSNFVPISGSSSNTVDAAIAQIVSGAVETSGSILNIGTISSTPSSPALNMPVQKMGRTTCLTSASVGAINVTISVMYPNACGLSFHGTATYTNQTEIVGSGFSGAGDSGSLILTTGACPQPVGLLFAGGRNTTFANPIGDVLSAYGVTQVGANACTPPLSVASSAAQADWQARAGANSRAVAAVSAIKDRHEHDLMQLDGVVGVGVGLASDGSTPTVRVLLQSDSAAIRAQLPNSLEGAPVEVEETGPIVAY
jgi:hypothetical protein